MVDDAARGSRAPLCIGKRQKIAVPEPDEMRYHHDERDGECNPRAERGQVLARLAIEHQKERKRQCQDNDEILCPQRKPNRESEKQPVQHAAAFERRMKRVACERPERQLNHIVIELGGRVMKVVQPVDDKDRNKSTDLTDQRPCRPPDQREGADHGELGECIIGGIETNQSVHDLDHPPRQGGQLVVADLPFTAIGEGFNEIERKIGVEHRRQCRPNQPMQSAKKDEGALRVMLDRRN